MDCSNLAIFGYLNFARRTLLKLAECHQSTSFFSVLQPVDKVLLAVRKEPLLEFHCKQMDHFVGLHFSNNFHFALMVHLVKGMISLCLFKAVPLLVD